MTFRFDVYAALAKVQVESEDAPTPPTVPTETPQQSQSVGGIGSVGRPSARNQNSADLSDYEERAAILEFDAGLSKAEAEERAASEQGFSDAASLHAAKIAEWTGLLSKKLKAETDPHGQKHIKASIRFCEDGWAAQALAFGWMEIELFGLCPKASWARLDRQGAAFANGKVAAVTAEAITFETGTRRYRTQSDGAVLAWEVAA